MSNLHNQDYVHLTFVLDVVEAEADDRVDDDPVEELDADDDEVVDDE